MWFVRTHTYEYYLGAPTCWLFVVSCVCVCVLLIAGQIYRDEHVLAFMDINPASRGHALVIPTHHAATLGDSTYT